MEKWDKDNQGWSYPDLSDAFLQYIPSEYFCITVFWPCNFMALIKWSWTNAHTKIPSDAINAKRQNITSFWEFNPSFQWWKMNDCINACSNKWRWWRCAKTSLTRATRFCFWIIRFIKCLISLLRYHECLMIMHWILEHFEIILIYNK